jgi:uncharacterized membrane protein YjgN (DUF898 family)
VQITCPCGKELRVPDTAVGKLVKCPGCGEKLLVEEPAPFEPPPRPSGRTAGRGSFVFDGGAADFLGTGILAWLLTVFTLGFGYPWALCMFQRWKARHTIIEGRRLAFNGGGGQLFGLWIKWFLLCIVTVGIYAFWVVPDMQRWIIQNTSFERG